MKLTKKQVNTICTGGRKGAPKGHDGHTLHFAENADYIVVHALSVCSSCGFSLKNVKSGRMDSYGV